MTQRQKRADLSGRVTPRAWRWGGASAALLLAIGAGAVVYAQVSSPAPPEFCYGQDCTFDSLDKAEQAMRSAPVNAAIANLLEPMAPNVLQVPNTGRAEYRYGVKDQPAATLSTPSFYPVVSAGYDLSGCTKGSDVNPGKSHWCSDEEQVKSILHSQIVNKHPGCTVGQPVQASINRPDPYKEVIGDVPFTISYGTVVYGNRNYTVSYDCNGTPGQTTIQIQMEAGFVCPSGTGWSKLEDGTPNDGNNDLTLPVLCKYTGGAVITGPVQQVKSCPGKRSNDPCYPTTGDKARQEPDFQFAGRTFTRYYHATHQFRNNIGSAIGWSHSYDDRIQGIPGTTNPAGLIDETGVYESFVGMSFSKLRGENSTGKVLETFSSGTVRWRLRQPDGEQREYDVNGRLLKVIHPSDPRLDVTLGYANGLLATATDGQGRMLRFQYDAAKLLKSIQLPDGSSVYYTHDANNNLTAVVYPDERIRRYHYAEPGLIGDASQRHHLTGISIEGNVRYASFKYDARGRVLESRVFGSPNNVTTVSYGSETQATFLNETGEQLQYTMQPGLYRRVTSIQSAGQSGQDGSEYNTSGQLIRSTDRRGIVTEYGYTGAHRTSVTLAVGTNEQRSEEFDHDPVTGLVTEQRVKDRTGALVAQSQWTYNSRGQVASSRMLDPATGASRSAFIRYCEASDVSAGTCPMVGLTIAVDGPRIGTADTTHFTYRMADDAGCATSPTACAYRKGDLWKTTNALGQTAEVLRHDGMGRVQSIRDINGVQTDIEYDPHGRVLTRKVRGADNEVESDDQVTRIAYNAVGAVQEVRLPDGVITRYEYDAVQRLTGIVDSNDNRMRFVLNAAGERVREDVQDASGSLLRTLSRTYDMLGNLHQQLDAQNRASTFLYDAEDNLTLETDRLGRKTRHEYDALGRLRNTLQDVDGVAASTQFQYDAQDRVTQVLDPNGLPTSYQYNGFGDLVRQESPDTGVATTTYDEAGNLKTRTDARGITATYGYDVLNRITSVAYPDNSRNTGFVYDTSPAECPAIERFHLGRLARMNDASGSTLYCYDRFGYLTRSLQSTQGRTFVLAYQRAYPGAVGNGYLLRPRPADGHLYGLTYPDGAKTNINRNNLRQVSSITVTLANGQVQTLLSGAVYYPFGPVSQWTYGNGRVMRRSRNQNYQPGFIETSGPGGLSIGYWFDAAGNLESLRRANQVDPARRKYRYDGLNRLTEVRDGATDAVLQAYAYDKTGNRSRRTDGTAGQDYAYVSGRHWLASVAGVARQYDVAGNTTRIGTGSQGTPPGGCGDCMEENPGPGDPGPIPIDPPPGETESVGGASTDGGVHSLAQVEREFAYDDAGRMRQVRHDGVVAMDYLYNGKGERVYRSGGSQSITTLYDDDGKWIGDYDSNGQPIQQAIWMDDLPVGLLVGAGANQKLYYIEADALGTPRVVTDPARNVAVWTWSLEGEAFGDSAPNQDADGDGTTFEFDMRFPGQRYDSATGMSYNYFRDYDSGAGRYIQSDPIGLSGGLATYDYAESRPVISIDRLGLSPEDGVGVHVTADRCELCAPDRRRFDSLTTAARTVLAAVYIRSRDKNIEICGQLCRDKKTGKVFIGDATLGDATSCNPWDKDCPPCSVSVAFWHTHGAPDGDYSEVFSSGEEKSDVAAVNWAAGITENDRYMGFLGTPKGFLVSYMYGTQVGQINHGRL